jgi:hypothetical protein
MNKPMIKRNDFFRQEFIHLAVLLAVVAALYAPVVGKGFIKDDFIWIDSSVKDGNMDISAPFKQTTGFFRPLVGISFGLQYEIFGLDPLPYGLFNLGFHLLNILLVYFLFKMFKWTSKYALIIAMLFGLNAKATRMAVGWISGRTALLYTFFLLLMFIFHIKAFKNDETGSNALSNGFRRRVYLSAAVIFFFCALLSKESSIAAPLFLFLFIIFDIEGMVKGKRIKKAICSTIIYIPVILLYIFLRNSSNAFTPFDAPEYYRFSLNPAIWLKNFFEYILRGGLLDIILIISLLAVIMVVRRSSEQFKSFISRNIFKMGLLWYAVFIILYLPIPYRSDLYSYFTQIGLHAAASVLIYNLAVRSSQDKGKMRKAIIIVLCVILACWIVYLAGKTPAIRDRGLASSHFSEEVTRTFNVLPAGSSILLLDKDAGDADSPSNTVSYSLNSLMKLFLPGKDINAVFISDEEKFTKDFNDYRFHYYWKKGSLVRMN